MVQGIFNFWNYQPVEEKLEPPSSSFLTENNTFYFMVGATALTVLLSYVCLRGCWKKKNVAVLQPVEVPVKTETMDPLPFSTKFEGVLERAQNLSEDSTNLSITMMVARAYCHLKRSEKALSLLQTALTWYRDFNASDNEILVDIIEVSTQLEKDKQKDLLIRILKEVKSIAKGDKITFLIHIVNACGKLDPSDAYQIIEGVYNHVNGEEEEIETLVDFTAEICHLLNPQYFPPFSRILCLSSTEQLLFES